MSRNIFVLFVLMAAIMLIVFAADSTDQTCQNDGTCNAPSVTTGNIPSKAKVAVGANEQGAPPSASISNCVDRYPKNCPAYVAQGECTKNPGWMIVNCAKSCNSCHLRDPKVRCDREFLNISTVPAFQPGELYKMFDDIETRFAGKYEFEFVSRDPPIVLFQNFLSDEEADAFIQEAEGNWERSTDTGATNEIGEAGRTISKSRTSSNAWCRHECEANPLVDAVSRRIEDITTVSFDNSESFQILRYEKDQFYRVHQDMSPNQNSLACGPRILTFYLYLSDVEEGGETAFPYVDIDVKPKKGSAVLWPSVMNHNLLEMDQRTHHQAKPVKSGVKYGANSWIHLYDFRKSNLWGCTGTFDYLEDTN